jgi:hypothetical protein
MGVITVEVAAAIGEPADDGREQPTGLAVGPVDGPLARGLILHPDRRAGEALARAVHLVDVAHAAEQRLRPRRGVEGVPVVTADEQRAQAGVGYGPFAVQEIEIAHAAIIPFRTDF